MTAKALATELSEVLERRNISPLTASSRVDLIDFLRGVALTIVLVDHVDFWAGPAGFFRNWTLMGLGWSDAAEGFVFLSGFTFGWVYSSRVIRDGLTQTQLRALLRTAQIYLAYLVTVFLVALFNGNQVPLDALALQYQPFATGILCLYITVLPFMPFCLALCRSYCWLVVMSSGLLYLAVQVKPQVNFALSSGEWYFNPFAWQFLFVLGLVFGGRSRQDRPVVIRSTVMTMLAVAVFVLVALFKKMPVFLSDEAPDFLRSWGSWMQHVSVAYASKTTLGPLRILHFMVLAYLVATLVSLRHLKWCERITVHFINCGKHSLVIYCVGVVLAYVSANIFTYVSATPSIVAIVVIDACLFQFACAWLLESFSRWKLSFRC